MVFKQELFAKFKEFKMLYGYMNKGMYEMLKLYGAPEQVIHDNDLDNDPLKQLTMI